MTRGAISKITKKLMQKGIIESYQKPKTRKKSISGLWNNGKRFIKFMTNCTKRFGRGIKLYLIG
jgi:DNA-binding MarR family transcriptional regulator